MKNLFKISFFVAVFSALALGLTGCTKDDIKDAELADTMWHALIEDESGDSYSSDVIDLFLTPNHEALIHSLSKFKTSGQTFRNEFTLGGKWSVKKKTITIVMEKVVEKDDDSEAPPKDMFPMTSTATLSPDKTKLYLNSNGSITEFTRDDDWKDNAPV